MDRLGHATEELFQAGQVEVLVRGDRNDAAERAPAGGGDLFLGRLDPLEREFPAVLAAGRDPRDCVLAEHVPVRPRNPILELLPGHPGIVGDQPGKVHRIRDARGIEVEGELVIGADPLADLLQLLDLDAEERLPRPVLHQHLLDGWAAERTEFVDDVFGGHGRASGRRWRASRRKPDVRVTSALRLDARQSESVEA